MGEERREEAVQIILHVQYPVNDNYLNQEATIPSFGNK